MATAFTPLERPDARRLYGFATRGGIVWRPLDPNRIPWAEHRGQRIIDSLRSRYARELAEEAKVADAMRNAAPEKLK
jgi:hypothetical protein